MSDQPETTRRPPLPDAEQRGRAQAAPQTLHDAKDLGLGVLASAAYDRVKPKRPLHDEQSRRRLAPARGDDLAGVASSCVAAAQRLGPASTAPR